MLTLLSMANFITGKVGQFDDVALGLCKGYIRKRYVMVWDDYFWRDSQTTTSVTVSAGDNSFVYPAGMERIVTIRGGDNDFLDPIDETFLIEADPSVLGGTGTPSYYS